MSESPASARIAPAVFALQLGEALGTLAWTGLALAAAGVAVATRDDAPAAA